MPLDQILLLAPVLLFSIVAHEYAHAEAAYRQGDNTAYMLGRLTLNPLKHIDPFLTIILPIMLIAMGGPAFGGAKPVPVNPRNYRNYRTGDIIVSLAGIATNLVLFIISAIGYAVVGLLGRGLAGLSGSLAILQGMLYFGMWVNLLLAFFNLIPLPPLDGSHVMKHLLPPAAGMQYRQLYALGMIPIVLVVWLLPGVVDAFLWPAHKLMGAAWGLVGSFR
ncbi:MAG TPA: site-2 protease family protein, partial [Gemmatimonadales bacterium]|nr:site-2 protease family protein [Gemmatimonadales bacterium]